MPWSAKDAHKHNHSITSPEQAHKWATVANSALHEYGDEGKAIATANAAVGGTIKHKGSMSSLHRVKSAR